MHQLVLKETIDFYSTLHIVDAVMASTTNSLTLLTKAASCATAANLRSLFHGAKVLKLLKRLPMLCTSHRRQQARATLRAGSLLIFRILPPKLTHLSTYVLFIQYMGYIQTHDSEYTCMYIHYAHTYIAPRVMHFSALIIILLVSTIFALHTFPKYILFSGFRQEVEEVCR